MKKGSSLDKTNYRPVSVLRIVPKVFERLTQYQINDYIIQKRFQHSTSIIISYRKLEKDLRQQRFLRSCFDGLIKSIWYIKSWSPNSKTSCPWFPKEVPLEFIYSCLCNRLYRNKVNDEFSLWVELIQGVPQGSVFGRFIFSIYFIDLLS